jgi:hypothetical protein
VPDSPGNWRSRVDNHAPRSALYPAERLPAEVYYPPDDDVDLFCPGCTPELGEHGWQHDRACPARRRTA